MLATVDDEASTLLQREIYLEISDMRKVIDCQGTETKKHAESFLGRIDYLSQYATDPQTQVWVGHLDAKISKILNDAPISQTNSITNVRTKANEITNGGRVFSKAQTPLTAKYRKDLARFRSTFSSNSNDSFFAFQTFLREAFLSDIFLILGDPPSEYDLRIVGWDLAFPYHSFKLIAVIEKEEDQPYFEKLIKWLEFLLASLGETAEKQLPLKTDERYEDYSGFYLETSDQSVLVLGKEIKT